MAKHEVFWSDTKRLTQAQFSWQCYGFSPYIQKKLLHKFSLGENGECDLSTYFKSMDHIINHKIIHTRSVGVLFIIVISSVLVTK
jgi:hypothetical protein